MPQVLFPQRPEIKPVIYAYEEHNPKYRGFLKVGYTTRTAEERVAEQHPVIQPGKGKPYTIVFNESAVRDDGSTFMDHDVHRRLERNGFRCVGGEWYECTVDDVRNAWLEVRDRKDYESQRSEDFKMRPEQRRAVDMTRGYFERCEQEGSQRVPRFLWNAKMRFGKTFATYELAKSMGMKRVLVLTFKPAVEDAWQDDLESHVDFEGWQFVARNTGRYEDCDSSRPIVCFGSFQDFLQPGNDGGIKPRNEWVHLEDWDLVVFDEYHFGAWKDSAKRLFESAKDTGDDFDDYVPSADDDSKAAREASSGNQLDETWLPIQSRFYLYLSGTPFRALNSGEFIEDQVFNWTYSDEQEAKRDWKGPHNPYANLPRMVLMTYKVPDSITRIARQGQFNEFDLNLFFSAKGHGSEARFVYEEYVQKWLDLIRGSSQETAVDDLRLGAEKPPMPFSDTRLLSTLTHTLWFLPNVSSCEAMANLLAQRQNTFFHDYEVIVAAGPGAGMGVEAVEPVREAMGDPLRTKTITLSCGKLTTGVTVRPWSGVLMLRNLRSPETYFQTAFRVQSSWTTRDDEGHVQDLKEECYVFDFALDRALTMVCDYSCRLSVNDESPEQKVGEFINFLPVLAYDGSAMREVDAADILDMAMAGTSATLLARRWESALLVNVDNDTLRRLLANEDAMRALMSIEGFRSLNDDIKTIINKSEAVKKAKREGGELTTKQKKELSDEEREYKTKRREVQEKLIKFATRIPVFMYLTDFREQCLKDVITQLEPGLFKKVTGLEVKDFELLVSLGVFNDGLMNDAVYKFRRYEDASLSYTGIERHRYDRKVGLFDTELTQTDYQQMRLQDEHLDSDGKARLTGGADTYVVQSITEERSSKEGEPSKVTFAVSSVPASPVETESEKAERERAQRKAREEARRNLGAKIDSLGAGDVISSKAFGNGRIKSIEGTRIVVRLGGRDRTFAFPDAFYQGFLKIEREHQ